MNKKISITIPKDGYKELSSLSDFYELDVENAIISILDVVGKEGQWIINLSKDYKVPVKLTTVMSHIFSAGFHSMRAIFNEVLENLEVKGLYTLGDLDTDLDENYVWLHFDALVGCTLQIDGFSVVLEPGLKTLSATSYIEVKDVSNEALGKLKKLVKSDEVLEEFGALELEDYSMEIEGDEEFCTLVIHCWAESLSYLPSIKRLSRFVEKLFKKAGIQISQVKD